MQERNLQIEIDASRARKSAMEHLAKERHSTIIKAADNVSVLPSVAEDAIDNLSSNTGPTTNDVLIMGRFALLPSMDTQTPQSMQPPL